MSLLTQSMYTAVLFLFLSDAAGLNTRAESQATFRPNSNTTVLSVQSVDNVALFQTTANERNKFVLLLLEVEFEILILSSCRLSVFRVEPKSWGCRCLAHCAQGGCAPSLWCDCFLLAITVNVRITKAAVLRESVNALQDCCLAHVWDSCHISFHAVHPFVVLFLFYCICSPKASVSHQSSLQSKRNAWSTCGGHALL